MILDKFENLGLAYDGSFNAPFHDKLISMLQMLHGTFLMQHNTRITFTRYCGEQGWHMWVEFVVGSGPCSGYSDFPLSSKTNTSKFPFDLESVPNLCSVLNTLIYLLGKFSNGDGNENATKQ